ncbi:MAG: FIST C-terminal domain-containing protein [Treponema sp.]|uniref:FIST signal transduction protein n=1 Tax=Treponema sp. TaxID=166 RepID=UPI00298E3A3F|nr:FIST N-terminal domain-containing protein [Treponema sp.]MBR5932465.1 FIST C-terminal domain-containing protein [Treponema sp.]
MERTVVSLSTAGREKALSDTFARIDSNGKPLAIIYFSEFENFEYYTEELYKKYPEAVSIGSTTYINFSTGGTSRTGLSVMAIFSGIEISAGAIHDISTYPMSHVDEIKNAVSKLSSTENTCCLEFTSAFSNGEEIVLDTFKEGLDGSGIVLAGSTAGAKEGLHGTKVALNGIVFNNTCVFALIHNLNGKIFIHKQNLFKPTNHTFMVTDVDCEHRVIYEYDNEPAADVLAKSLNLSLEELSNKKCFYPVGRIKGKDIMITSLDRIDPDGSIVCYSRVYNNTKQTLLTFGNFDAAMLEIMASIRSRIHNCSFVIGVQCISNCIVLEKERLFDYYTKTLKDNFTNFIGIAGYGEQYYNNHLNQAVITIAFE